MNLPLLLSVPHAGIRVPDEIAPLCILTRDQIIEDGDEGAGEIYDLSSKVGHLVTTEVARAILDMNRAPEDRSKDGIVKTHTCWDVPVYREPPPEELIRDLLDRHYHPYHSRLTEHARDVVLGIDCHTMAAKGPPIGPDPGTERPAACLSNADGTCSHEWLASLAGCLERALGSEVSLNDPFKGGYIIRRHANELPWIQLELSRAPFLTNREKREAVHEALVSWCREAGV